jgi:mannose-6-phosphate isomerase
MEAASVQGKAGDRTETPEGLSTVHVEGEEIAFRDLLQDFGPELLGDAVYDEFGTTTPVIAKLIDTEIRHVVQCHPTQDFARTYLNYPWGKNEAWVFLESRGPDDSKKPESPYVYLGFREGVGNEEIDRALREGSSEELLGMLNKIDVSIGDAVFVPAGVPHALGPGLLIIEVQEPADYLFRADRQWKEAGATLTDDQRHLGLGYETMLKAFDRQQCRNESDVRENQVFEGPRFHEVTEALSHVYFTGRPNHPFGIQRVQIHNDASMGFGDRFFSAIVTRGHGRVSWDDGSAEFKAGDGIFFPASLGQARIVANEACELVLAWLDGEAAEVT